MLRVEAFLAGCAQAREAGPRHDDPPGPTEAPEPAVLERALAELHDRAASTHPTVPLDARTFAYALGARAGSVAGLARLSHAELYLALAAAEGQAAAIEALEVYVARELDAATRRAPAQEREDLLQAIRLRLYTGAPPGLAAYSGVGSLRGFVRVTATRVVLNALTRAPAPAVVDESAWLEALTATQDPELLVMKGALVSQLQAAIAAGFAALTPRERNLLRYAVGQGATVDQVAAVFGTHRSSAARWVTAARARLTAEVRAELERRLGSTSASVRALLALVESQLSLGLERSSVEPGAARPDGPPGPGDPR